VSAIQQIEQAVRRPRPVGAEGSDGGLRCLALLHGACCAGRFDVVPRLLQLAVETGVGEPRLHEALLQVVAYGGFPRALEGLGLLARSRREPPPPALAEPPHDAGRATWDAVYREHSEEVLGALEALLPGLSRRVLDGAYRQILSRPGLALRDRELLAVAALGLMALPAPLGSHVRGALRNGSAPELVIDILDTVRALASPEALAVIDQAVDRISRNVYRA
jgi:4-carboxymuconolactone decarboxylase